MTLALNAGGPVPLYHPIAEVIGYRIVSGKLLLDAVLPPVWENR